MGKVAVNNAYYETLGNRWYSAKDDPIALLRQEAKTKNPWVLKKIQGHAPLAPQVLDVGCGAGLLSNYLAQQGLEVSGLDASAQSLEVAKAFDPTKSVDYQHGNAYRLPYADQSFDVVCAMDFLEHVERPHDVIKEINRVLRPQGLFFFHTFNKNWASYLLVIKAVEWLVKNTPRHLHIYRLFIKPKQLIHWGNALGLRLVEVKGIRPKFLSWAFLRGLWSGEVNNGVEFKITNSLALGYLGFFRKGP